ncbi:MAG: extracellular solute-binding protein [Ruminococcus flavefaciens]|nr:extracellular solute-binding protein [Ruminococcus flavefaciens]
MKNHLIRRSVTGVMAVAMVFSAYSCGEKKDGSSKKEKTTQTAQKANEVIKNSYSSIDIDLEIPADYIEGVFFIKETSQVMILGNSDESYSLYLTDMDFSGFNEIKLDFDKPENSQYYLRATVSPDGYIYAFLTIMDYGDFQLPDYDAPDFDPDTFDYEAMNEARQYSYKFYKLGSDGQILAENDVTNLDEYSESDSPDGSIHIQNIVADAKGNIIAMAYGNEDRYLIMNENGEITGEIDKDNNTHWINSFGTDSDGNIICTGYGADGQEIQLVDPDGKKFTDSGINVKDSEDLSNINNINMGAGEYTLFMSTQKGLYGVGADKKPVEVINWIDSDIKSDTVQFVIGLDDGDFIVYQQDYDTNTFGFSRLTKRDPEELANQQVITVGMLYSDTAITSMVTEFNKSHSDYRIKISDYSKYNEYDDQTQKATNTAQKQLKMDISSGNAPDMIVTYDFSLISELAPQGIYTDLYSYLENDDKLSKDDIMPNLIKASEIDGKLYSLSPNFNVTSLACKTKFCDKENWTLDDLIDTIHENPDMRFSDYANSKEYVFEILINCCDELIDYEKAECHFDSDEFKKILEFCNEFPDEEDEINWETATQDEMEAYWNEQETMCLEDKALLSDISFYQLSEYNTVKTTKFNEDITLVGMPSSNGQGALLSMGNSFAILESSPSKDACWEFIKEFFTEDYQIDSRYTYSLPSLVSAFDKKAEEAMEKPYYLDENGEKVEYDMTYWVNNKEITIEPLTKEEKDLIVEYIKNASKMSESFSDDIREIIVDEVTKYFKGETNSQQTIDMIQNRVSLLLSEKS